MRYASILFVLLLFNPSSVRADVTTGLVAWYPFNLDMLDASGNGNHGSPVGGVVPTIDRFGTPDGAYEFNGTNSYIFVANSTSLSSPDTAVTQAAWVMPYGPSLVGQAFGPVTMKSASAPNAFMYRLIATPDGTFGSSYNDWFNFYGDEYPAADEWHHVASVFDGDHVRLYLDGVRVDSLAAPLTITPGPQDLTIGGDIPGILEIFNGKIDDVRIYSRALTDDDVAELCSCGSTGVGDTGRGRCVCADMRTTTRATEATSTRLRCAGPISRKSPAWA